MGTENVTNQVFIIVRKQANTRELRISFAWLTSLKVYLPAIQAIQPPSGCAVVDATGSGIPLLRTRLGTGIKSESPCLSRSCWGVDEWPPFSNFGSMLLGELLAWSWSSGLFFMPRRIVLWLVSVSM
jgi:hypothetical protein